MDWRTEGRAGRSGGTEIQGEQVGESRCSVAERMYQILLHLRLGPRVWAQTAAPTPSLSKASPAHTVPYTGLVLGALRWVNSSRC